MNRTLNRRMLLAFLILVGAFFGMAYWLDLRFNRRQELNEDLIIALRLGHTAEVKSLLAQGADPNARDLPALPPKSVWQHLMELLTNTRQHPVNTARTALSCAMDSRQPEVAVKLLLEHGANIKADEQCDDPALLEAAGRGFVSSATLLLNRGADVNLTDRVGDTPLLSAVMGGEREMVQLLIARGAKVNVANIARETPLSYARMSGRHDLIALLKQAGAKQ